MEKKMIDQFNQRYRLFVGTVVFSLSLLLYSQAYASGPSDETCETDGIIVRSASELTNKLSSGKTLLLGGGTYQFSTLTIPSGSLSQPTIIKPYNCEKVVINVRNKISPGSNTIVAGLYIKQSGGYGQAVSITGNTYNVTIRHNDLSNPSSSFVNGSTTLSVKKGPQGILIYGNYFHDCNEDCIQLEETGNFVIKHNELKGGVFENLLDIKTTRADSHITGNLFWCNTLKKTCIVLHGETQTNAIVTFEKNRLTGCPTEIDKQVHINGKDRIANRYDVIGNLFTSKNTCRAIQYKACDGCMLMDNGFYNTRIQKGTFSGAFRIIKETGNIYTNAPHSEPDVVPGDGPSRIIKPVQNLRVIAIQ
jgi:hypothetical protein